MKIKLSLIALLSFSILITSCSHQAIKPALDISNATYAQITNGTITINEIEYDGSIRFKPDYIEAYELAGPVIAYYINDDHYVYYFKIEGLKSSDWLLEVSDNGHGHIDREFACFVKAKGNYTIPLGVKPMDA